MPVDRAALIARLEEIFAGHNEFAAVYLFGSVARNQDRADSDIDIAVLYKGEAPGTLLEAHFGLEADLGEKFERSVQIVVMNTAPVDLVHRVLRDGVLIAEKDPTRRVRFIVDARNRYWDMLPIWNEYRGVSK